jgi:hypothetical protein
MCRSIGEVRRVLDEIPAASTSTSELSSFHVLK